MNSPGDDENGLGKARDLRSSDEDRAVTAFQPARVSNHPPTHRAPRPPGRRR